MYCCEMKLQPQMLAAIVLLLSVGREKNILSLLPFQKMKARKSAHKNIKHTNMRTGAHKNTY